jgi:hypothetical protein
LMVLYSDNCRRCPRMNGSFCNVAWSKTMKVKSADNDTRIIATANEL